MAECIPNGRVIPALALCLTLLCVLFPARSATSDADPYEQCPDAARERLALLPRRHIPKDVAMVTRPALRKELLDMQQRDQAARRLYVASFDSTDNSAVKYIEQVDKESLRQLKHIVIQDGFPTVAMVGIDGVHAAFLLTQHADTDTAFQENILQIFKRRLPSHDIDPGQYAMLMDRVLTTKRKPQRYGTQFEERDGDSKPYPIEDEAHVDERRHALGIMSIANYACLIRAVNSSQH
jgi:hypothetical protein